MTKDPWNLLLSTHRYGRNDSPNHLDARSEFDRDHDRIVFSSAFRRLKDKTQVFPLSKNDFTRTRLTHSIEVSCVGRSLGTSLETILEGRGVNSEITRSIPTIVAAACLAHDIGNPPFGHSGEDAIQAWAKQNVALKQSELGKARFCVDSDAKMLDLHNFEGNAQGLRILCRLQARSRVGGLQLTHATLGAMLKYPCDSQVKGRSDNDVACKKFGFFQSEKSKIVSALSKLGMVPDGDAFRRHPLAFLVEAADDICNTIVDLEDSIDQQVVSYEDAIGVLEPLVAAGGTDVKASVYKGDSRLRWLQASSISSLSKACEAVVKENLDLMLDGTMKQSLIDQSNVKSHYDKIRDLVQKHAYPNQRVLKVELAGFKVIGGLLDIFAPALLNDSPNKADEKILGLFPRSHLYILDGQDFENENRRELLDHLTNYERLLAITDYISGMTDSFAVELFQELSGIQLPA